MERFKLTLAEDGQILVDKAVIYRIEKGEYDKPGAFLPFS
jgi:cytochrome b6-f complex iron-sulfur subunit